MRQSVRLVTMAIALIAAAGVRPAGTEEPPTIRIFFPAPRMHSGGGTAIIQAWVKDDAAVTSVSASVTRPDGHTSSSKLTLFQPASAEPSGTAIWQILWPIAANTSTDSAVYVVKAWVLDAKGRETRAEPANLVVLGRPAESIQPVRPHH